MYLHFSLNTCILSYYTFNTEEWAFNKTTLPHVTNVHFGRNATIKTNRRNELSPQNSNLNKSPLPVPVDQRHLQFTQWLLFQYLPFLMKTSSLSLKLLSAFLAVWSGSSDFSELIISWTWGMLCCQDSVIFIWKKKSHFGFSTLNIREVKIPLQSLVLYFTFFTWWFQMYQDPFLSLETA